MTLLFITFAFLNAFGEDDCGVNRIYPSDTWSDSEYNPDTGRLLDGSLSTFWRTDFGELEVSVYIEFANYVEIKHITIGNR